MWAASLSASSQSNHVLGRGRGRANGLGLLGLAGRTECLVGTLRLESGFVLALRCFVVRTPRLHRHDYPSLHFKVAGESRSPCGSADFARGRPFCRRGAFPVAKTEALSAIILPQVLTVLMYQARPFRWFLCSRPARPISPGASPQSAATGWNWRPAAE